MRDPYLFLGIHGVIDLAPWIGRAREHHDLEEDAFGLVAKRSEMMGLGTFGAEPSGGEQWLHADAGGDWAPGHEVHQLVWMQVAVDRGRLPIQAIAALQGAVLARLGIAAVAGVHAVLPLHLAIDSTTPLAVSRDWFAFADPSARSEFRITADSGSAPDARDQAHTVLRDIAERAADVLTIDLVDNTNFPWDAFIAKPAGARPVGTHRATFRCQGPEWSVELAAWVIELLGDAYRSQRSKAAMLIAVSASPGQRL